MFYRGKYIYALVLHTNCPWLLRPPGGNTYSVEPLYVKLFIRSTSRYFRSYTLNVKVGLGYGKAALFWSSRFLTLSYSSKVNAVLYPQRVSQPVKKTPWYVLRGQCFPAHPVVICSQSTMLTITAFWRDSDLNKCPKRTFLSAAAVIPD